MKILFTKGCKFELQNTHKCVQIFNGYSFNHKLFKESDIFLAKIL